MYDSIIILGPTASGKTSLSIELAKTLNTEIINADSMYIYRDLNIGTAKPTKQEMSGIKHHLIGFLDTNQKFNVSEYRKLAEEKISEFKTRNIVPIIVGGTGFYIDSLIGNYSYGETQIDDKLRIDLEQELKLYGKEYMFNKLKEIDPKAALTIEQNDSFRVLRAIEVFLTTGKSKLDIENFSEPILKEPLIIGLNTDRDKLYERINMRVDIMLQNGLIEEVRNLYNLGFNPNNSQAMKGIGYKELVDYFDGNISLNTTIEKIKQHSRNYAKRQITWFKRNQKIIWFDPLKDANICAKIKELFYN